MPLISYNRDIPNPPNNPSADVTPMQNNTNAVDDIIDVDHFSFNDTSFSGNHKQCTFVIQTPPVVPTTSINQIAIYPKAGVSGTELFMIRDNNAGTETSLTTSKIGAPNASTNGSSWLPGGILILWGQATGDTDDAIAFSPAFPNNVFSVQTTIFENNNNRHFVHVKTMAVNQFTIASRDSSGSNETNTFSWIAIGN